MSIIIWYSTKICIGFSGKIKFYMLFGLGFQYHGGTNFGRTSGGPFIATSYDYDAPLDEFGT